MKTLLGSPVIRFGYYSGLHATYQELVSWTVAANKYGYLDEISFGLANGSEAYALMRLTIDGVVQFEDIKSVGDVTFSLYSDVIFPAGTVIILEIKSDGEHTISANGSITGKAI